MDCIKNAIRNIWRKRVRSIMTVMGIGIGVLSVIVIASIGELGKRSINEELDSIGVGGLAISVDSQALAQPLDDRDLSQIRGETDVLEAMPLIMEYTQTAARGESSGCVVWGVDEDVDRIISMKLLYGRMMNRSDLAASADVCVVDESFAFDTYARSNIVGKSINVLLGGSYREYEVVGVVASGGNVFQNLMGGTIPSFLYVPYTALQRVSGKSGFDQIAVKLEDGVDADTAAEKITARLEAELGVPDSIHVQNIAQQKDQLNQILNIVTLILAIIAGISLIVAGLSIMTVMLVSVHERTREIGIKKSIGASKATILFEFMMESLLISLFGSIAGAVIGTGLVWLGCTLMGTTCIINMPLMLFCIGFAVLIGMVFGVYPAIKAANLKPVDALRFE